MSVAGNEEFTRGCFSIALELFTTILQKDERRHRFFFLCVFAPLGRMRVLFSGPAAVWHIQGPRRPDLCPCTPVRLLNRGKLGSFKLRWLFMPRKWDRANGRACLRFAGKVCFGLRCCSGWPTVLTGPGRRDFTKPTRPGRIWTESKQQPLTPLFTRESKQHSHYYSSAWLWWFLSCTDQLFKNYPSYIWCLAYTSSIHLPASIVFLTAGFLFPVLAVHTAPLTCTCGQSSPSFSPTQSCVQCVPAAGHVCPPIWTHI